MGKISLKKQNEIDPTFIFWTNALTSSTSESSFGAFSSLPGFSSSSSLSSSLFPSSSSSSLIIVDFYKGNLKITFPKKSFEIMIDPKSVSKV